MKYTNPHIADELFVAARPVGLVPRGGASSSLAVAVRRVAAPVVGAAFVAELQRTLRRTTWTLYEIIKPLISANQFILPGLGRGYL